MISMATKGGGLSLPVLVMRAVVLISGAMALGWAFFASPIFWKQYPIEKTAAHIIAGDVFKIEAVTPIAATFVNIQDTKWSRPSIQSAAAVTDLRLLERAMAAGDRKNVDGLMDDTAGMIRRSLANSPADPFLWTVLFWLENTRNGFKRGRLSYLDMSYILGPNEGWVAVKRNRFALAIYPSLPPALAADVVSEYSRLVGSGFFGEAADILDGPGWPVHDILITGLKDVDEDSRQTFSKVIYRRGFDLEVPGVERPEWRPWH
jgi:hypothetical protein